MKLLFFKTSVLCLLSIFVALLFYIIQPNIIAGNSMSPTFNDKSVIFTVKTGTFEVGDIASFYIYKKPTFSSKLRDVYNFATNGDFELSHAVLLKRIDSIENDCFFMVGDNRKDSWDSRDFGCIKREQMMRKVVLILKF